MERLSEKLRMYIKAYKQPPFGREVEGTVELLEESTDKLAEYEDLEEQGRLLKLPCKSGDTIWLVGDKYTLDYKVSGFAIDSSGISIIFLEKEIDGKMHTRSIDYTEIGKTAFLTKEEAEEVLRKIK